MFWKSEPHAEELTATTADGVLAQVTGIVRRADREMRAPMSARPCVAFAVRVTEPHHHEPGSWSAPEPYDCVELVPFEIECDAGRVLIVSDFAELDLPIMPTGRPDDETWTAFCDHRRLSPVSHGEERLLPIGARVTVIGTTERAIIAPGREAGFRDAETQLRLVGDFDHPIVIREP